MYDNSNILWCNNASQADIHPLKAVNRWNQFFQESKRFIQILRQSMWVDTREFTKVIVEYKLKQFESEIWQG